jgi:phage repressor protein C with HTH and peptisase S24 domain
MKAGGVKVSWQALQQIEAGDSAGSKYLVPLARALGVSPDWLFDERGPANVLKPQALLVGKVGAGAEIHRFEEGVVLASIEAPPGLGDCNAAEVEGDSMYPQLEAGWTVFYGPEHQGIPEECVGRLCVVQVKDGPILLKKLMRGSRKGLWRLESWNAPLRDDVKVDWAAKVLDIRPK